MKLENLEPLSYSEISLHMEETCHLVPEKSSLPFFEDTLVTLPTIVDLVGVPSPLNIYSNHLYCHQTHNMGQVSVCISGMYLSTGQYKSDTGGNISDTKTIATLPYFMSAETREYVSINAKDRK